MKIKNVYVADDGEEFETEEECLKHEEIIQPDGAVLLFDSDMNWVTEEKDPVERYEDSIYLYIIDAEKAKVWFDWVYEQTSYDVPTEYKTGELICYDEDEQYHISVDEKLNKLLKIRNTILDKVKTVYGHTFRGDL